jgi:peroxiredoxin Q/BCP
MSELQIDEGDRFPTEDLGRALDGPAVVYFYPKDSTSGCELESRGFDDLYDDFRSAGVDVVGVSNGTAETAGKFASDCGLRFELVPDESGKLVGRLGLLKDFGEYGILPQRVTFLVDGDGVVRRIWQVEDIQSHPAEVLAAAREL